MNDFSKDFLRFLDSNFCSYIFFKYFSGEFYSRNVHKCENCNTVHTNPVVVKKKKIFRFCFVVNRKLKASKAEKVKRKKV